MIAMLVSALQSVLYISLQYASFVPAMLFNLGFLGLTGGVLWLCLPASSSLAARRVTAVAVGGLLGILYIGAVALPLAMLGVFSGPLFFTLWLVGLALLLLRARHTGAATRALAAWRQAAPIPRWFWLAVLIWLLLYGRPFEMVIGGRDPGVYVNIAAQIAERGAIAVKDPFFAGLPPAIQREFVWTLPASLVPFRAPGFFWIGSPDGRLGSDPGLVLPQFMPFYPALMAPSYTLAGYNGALTVLPFGVLVLALIVGQLAQLLFAEDFGGDAGSNWLAALPVLFLLLAPACFWFGRMANADIYLGLFTMASAYFWAHAASEPVEEASASPMTPSRAWLWLLVVASFAAALLTKIDSWLVLPGVVLGLLIYNPSRQTGLRWVRRVAWAAIVVTYLTVANWLVYPYILYTLRGEGISISGFGHYGLFIAGGILLVVTLAGSAAPILAPYRIERLQTHLRFLARGAAVAIPALLVAAPILGSMAVPRFHIRMEAFGTLAAYWPLPLLVLSVAGLVLLIVGRTRWWSVPLLVALACDFVYASRLFASQDLPWNLRRTVSIVFPVLALLAGGGAAAAVRWLASRHRNSDRRRAWVLGSALALLFVPLVAKDTPFFFHDEAWQARAQMAYFRGMFPANSVILSSGTQAARDFGPGLSSNGQRVVLEYFSSDVAPAFDPSSIEVVAEKALAQGRPFFYLAEDDDPPPTDRWQFEDYWRGTWPVRTMSGDGPPELLRPTVTQIYFRVYRSLGPIIDGKRPDPRAAVYEAESLEGIIGHMVADTSAENGWARMAGVRFPVRDSKGALVFGPYTVMPPGSYLARFRVRTTDVNPAVPDHLWVMGPDPNNAGKVSIVGSREITKNIPAYTFLDVPFSLDKPEPLEYSLFYSGEAKTWLDRVEVLKSDVRR